VTSSDGVGIPDGHVDGDAPSFEPRPATGVGTAWGTEVASFVIHRYRCLDINGRLHGPVPTFARNRDEMITLYRAMVLTRAFDEKAVALQRTGRLGTFASSLGQEAVAVGIGAGMRSDDILVPSFREQGAQLWRGVRPLDLLLYWGGDERGNDFAGPVEDFPICVPVGTQAAHAAGVALALRLRRESRATVCVLGDGATSRGDVNASMNFAGARQLPVVFVVNNNQWAISVPRTAQTAAETLAQKAVGAGIHGEQVDGNDVIAVRARIEAALKRARSGDGPTLVEALTYRLADHTTADDASRYRSDDEVSGFWRYDPVARVRAYLTSAVGWRPEDEQRLLTECRDLIDAATDAYLATPPGEPTDMFDHLFATLPPVVVSQRQAVLARRERYG
jgi:pyruvate dehydrogenase E1 component alpha subunit